MVEEHVVMEKRCLFYISIYKVSKTPIHYTFTMKVAAAVFYKT
jgi:hypothetical protein